MVPFNEESMNRDQNGDIANKAVVATFVSTLPESLQCHARELTALPAVPLLTELLLLIFHPASYGVEWLTNNQTSKIVGFELARRDQSTSNDNWSRERSATFLFKTDFRIEDIRAVNSIRKTLSNRISGVYHTQDDWSTNGTDNSNRNRVALPEELQNHILQLLKKQRNTTRSRSGNKASRMEPRHEMQDSGFYPQLDVPKLNADSGYDSEEEEHNRRLQVVKRLKQVAFGVTDSPKPSLLCKTCGCVLCSLENLTYEPTDWSFTLFRMQNCFGSVFAENHVQPEGPIDSYALCQQNHRIGYTVNGFMFVDSNCPVEVEKDGNRYNFTPDVWENNFAKIGGVGSQQQMPREELSNYDCEICDKRFKTRRLLASHLSTQKHQDEEQYYLGST
mmetsp:Transcript_29344/g.41302  ORF Transcript_29344/g.41302 Transcript_29344/m.41302 type:complete len:391 (+) Transcript_29344:1-1173(+)